jgi:hypothetical protein
MNDLRIDIGSVLAAVGLGVALIGVVVVLGRTLIWMIEHLNAFQLGACLIAFGAAVCATGVVIALLPESGKR